MNLFPVAAPPPGFISPDRGHPPADKDFFLWLLGFPDEEMVGDHEARQPGGEFENTGSVQGKDHERFRSIFHQPLACWTSQGRGAPSIEYRDRQKTKEACVKIFVEKYDTVTGYVRGRG